MYPNFLQRSALSLAVLAALTLVLPGCSDSHDDTPSVEITKPAIPTGLGSELSVPLPAVDYPLPSAENAANNADSALRYNIDQNPIANLLKGINNIWTAGFAGWQQNANGNGPDNFDGQQIVNATVWKENIQYVVKVTANRSQDQSVEAFLDDQRSKNYSVIDGYGPLTEAYVAGAGAYTDIHAPALSDVLSNAHYSAANNDGIQYAGSSDSELGAVYQLVYDFRQAAPASTSASKYLFSTPRPWRMDDDGQIDYLGSANYSCVDADSNTDNSWIFDSYTSSVKVVPGLVCARRHHESSIIADDQENRRKDGAFPSGHTNAGYLAAMAYAYALPQRYAEMLTRGSQLGENRILAGMHSPVDVIGGRIHALAVAAYALGQSTIQSDAQAAYTKAQSYFGAMADSADMSLYAYAHTTVANPGSLVDGSAVNTSVFNNNRYSDHAAMKALYRARLTYGFTQTGTAGAAAIVPQGAELLLASRQPYLSAEQRRAVLATTEVDSGYPILDESNGWGRLDLVMASDGYGAFNGDVTVDMDAADGGFSSHDWWRNDISGTGMLTKEGTGTLTLTGANSYSGGTLVKAGSLEAQSPSAFGAGDLYVSAGNVLVNASGAVTVANFTQDDGTLTIDMDDDAAQLQTTGTAYISGGQLVLNFSSQPAAGSQFTLISAGKLAGEFASVSAGAVKVALSYTDTAVIATVQ
ncbi:phosphatase PAP2 family protein [Gallaecimonas pentaromativorans]|uniref:phosphatase PAP2 family protein n=1 Tax=Gallaecimonas pentaromativorans TaxID=584787 RepID=UPI003A8F1B59